MSERDWEDRITEYERRLAAAEAARDEAERERATWEKRHARRWEDVKAACARAESAFRERDQAREALRGARSALEDERLHREVSETEFYVKGCEACDAISAIDAALAAGEPEQTARVLKATGDEPLEVVNSGAEDWVDDAAWVQQPPPEPPEYDYEADIARGSALRRPGERPWEAAKRLRAERAQPVGQERG